MGEQDLAKAATSCYGCGTPSLHRRASGTAGSEAPPLQLDLGHHHPLQAKGADLHCRTAGPGVLPLSPDLERRRPLIPSFLFSCTLLLFSLCSCFSPVCCWFSPAHAVAFLPRVQSCFSDVCWLLSRAFNRAFPARLTSTRMPYEF
ncbi:hypothetical protein GUJ93_ZPchr0005g16175 [Zizania palustris]|uniref:Uncharacterized protein n=1 Tax=Zizania palustris TaxID=103762 RepID=A0A8J5SP04_ZIZPA|nr:hypothetical protein GUJ93_ZPchr0005g16175 [Zizania palustris]